MSICKTSSFGENRSTLRRSSQLEENILQKNLSLLRSMRQQYESKFGLESKAITRKITNSLERSAQIDSRIMSMKSSMAPENRRHYRIKDHSTAEILKDAWNNDDTKARISAMICTVILPTAVNLLEEQGMAVGKAVMLQLEDLQKAHSHYLKRPNSMKKKKRSKSLGDRSTFVRSANSMLYDDSRTRNDSETDIDPRISSSYLTTSELESAESYGQSRSIRSHTVQLVKSDLSRSIIGKGSPRPVSAPGVISLEQPLHRNAIPPSICEEESDRVDSEKLPIYLQVSSEYPEIETSAESKQNKNFQKQVLPDKDDPDEISIDTTECPLRKLHTKLHTSMESVTLVDVHKALVTTKSYPSRMEDFLRCIEKWKIPEEDDVEAEEYPPVVQLNETNHAKRRS